MILDPQKIATREKLILAGLYLSKYDSAGLKKLGFESFIEAFNVIGYALGGKPASIKNYRDEFDPLVSKRRRLAQTPDARILPESLRGLQRSGRRDVHRLNQ